MSKPINYKLPYEKDGKIKDFNFNIKFVPHGFVKKYNELIMESYQVKIAWDEISDLTSKIASLKVNKADNEEIKNIENKIEDYQKIIIDAGDAEIDKRRFELVSILLKKNGYNQEFLHDFDFWDWNVEPGSMLDFMSVVAFGDNDNKKKAMTN